MKESGIERRDFLKYVLGGVGMLALDWNSLPRAVNAFSKDNSRYDAVIIGSGLGGLSCAAGFARQGFKVLVVEQHDKPGGYATSFQRPGGFTFDVLTSFNRSWRAKWCLQSHPRFPRDYRSRVRSTS